ncbi:MAG: hypothetical protein L0H79_21555, partial [Intrasporangium sp.]|uniref:hypothetical protein n=1 Tax=Intrasporangium sp. TaxID=1925024 RepID=UPI00264A4D9F
ARVSSGAAPAWTGTSALHRLSLRRDPERELPRAGTDGRQDRTVPSGAGTIPQATMSIASTAPWLLLVSGRARPDVVGMQRSPTQRLG